MRLQSEDALQLAFTLEFESGRYPFTLAILDRNSDGDRGNWFQDTLVVPAHDARLPSLSDIAVAADSGGTWSRDGATFLRVSPSHVTNPEGFVHVYFEVYGIASQGPYEVDLRLVPERQSERVYKIRPEDTAFTLRFVSEMPEHPDPIGRHHLRLDLRDTEEGQYVLAVRVTDLTNGVESLPSTTLLERL